MNFRKLMAFIFWLRKSILTLTALRIFLLIFRRKSTICLYFFATNQNGKALLSCFISKELVNERNLNAGQIVRELGKFIHGGGGGQPFFATAGGNNPDGIKKALDAAINYLN